MTTHTATLWVDPLCPWAWLTSRWLKEVQQVRDLTVHWRIMSLAVLNEGRDLPPDYQKLMTTAWGPVRVLNHAAQQHGHNITETLYTEIGTRTHPQGNQDLEHNTRAALAATGLPADLMDVYHTADVDDLVRTNHHEAQQLVGDDVGTPVIATNNVAFFGPVLSPTPTGEAAGKLWDGVVLVASTPEFFELKRSRTIGPQFN